MLAGKGGNKWQGARSEARDLSPRMRRWAPILRLRSALTATLTYLRRNRVQAEIAENYGVSQLAISRAISPITRYWCKRSLTATARITRVPEMPEGAGRHCALD
jgi:hypothetical protein